MGILVNRKPPKTPSLLCRAYMWTLDWLRGKSEGCLHPNKRMVSQPPGFRAEYYCSDCDAYLLEDL